MLNKKIIVSIGIFAFVISGVLIGSTLLAGDSQEPINENESVIGPDGVDQTGNDLVEYNSEEFANGVDRQGYTSTLLSDEYDSTLQNSTFQLNVTRKIDSNNSTSIQRAVYRKSNQGVTFEFFVDDELKLQKYADLETETVYVRKNIQSEPETSIQTNTIIEPSNSEVILDILRSGEFDPKQGQKDNSGVEVLMTTVDFSQKEPLENQFDIERATSITGVTRIGSNQIIRAMNVTVSGTHNGSNKTVQYTSSVKNVNSTIVNQPPWVNQVKDSTRTTTKGIASDGRTLVLSHDEGEDIPPGTNIKLSVRNGDTFDQYSYTLNRPLESNETMYFRLHENELVGNKGQLPPQQGEQFKSVLHYVEIVSPENGKTVLEFSFTP